MSGMFEGWRHIEGVLEQEGGRRLTSCTVRWSVRVNLSVSWLKGGKSRKCGRRNTHMKLVQSPPGNLALPDGSQAAAASIGARLNCECTSPVLVVPATVVSGAPEGNDAASMQSSRSDSYTRDGKHHREMGHESAERRQPGA